MKKALFLDRDGIINVDHGYVHKIEDFEFVDGIFELCRRAQSKGYQIFVITNQAGIARGYYDIATFETLTSWMISQFHQQEVTIEKVYFCPHHPNKGVNKYVKSCQCRKPAPGMIVQAQQEYALSLADSVFIGDKLSDMQAAEQAGIEKKILVASRYVQESSDTELVDTDHIKQLSDAIELL